ncbi:hypothetical protein TrLO_g2428 [Triparma laevis f. longispina]|uniref:CTP synthase n=1 Tax=Triparma laevis f. longispina TaxID=1714387 RepID=A0A9W7FLX9_9STRA|nr:hypothetical protein TrLO_g2428 [Triparma laevis f. longispina]
MKYIVVSGGVVSGLGKGITISSIGRLLLSSGLTVTSIKIDPYLNVDAGTMSPFEHGEVFTLHDGGEADLDLGNYERFLGVRLGKDNNITTGKVYRKVIARERRGDYLGKTVQVVPHITNEIQEWIERVAHEPVQEEGESKVADVCLIELGGTVGDIESMVFLEALRQFQFRVGDENFMLMFVSLVPVLGSVGEQKTKPTQHGVKELRSLGLSPKVIFCRCSTPVEPSTCAKISSFCHVPADHCISVHDVDNIYHVPLLLMEQNLHNMIATALKIDLPINPPNIADWRKFAVSIDQFTVTCKIALIGKYSTFQDSYLSVIKALKHASVAVERDLDLMWVEASDLIVPDENDPTQPPLEEGETWEHRKAKHKEAWDMLKSADGVIVPGGFGVRGVEGKIAAAEYCRKEKKPYLGVCLGFQVMVMEYARNVLGMSGANSTEFDENCENPVVVFMPEIDKDNLGGTMRLGARDTLITPHANGELSTSFHLYGKKEVVSERHRHRYEVNPEKIDEISKAGLSFVGKDETSTRMEIAELPRSVHPFYVGCQYHPEFQSRPLKASPPFHGLLMAAAGQLNEFLEK